MNVAIRQELKANGGVAPEDHTFRVLVQRQEMTGAERSWATRYEINDVVRYVRGSKSAGIEAGEYATVVGINSTANLLTVEKPSGKVATYDPRRLTGVSVYREVAHEFFVGDRIQFTAPDTDPKPEFEEQEEQKNKLQWLEAAGLPQLSGRSSNP